MPPRLPNVPNDDARLFATRPDPDATRALRSSLVAQTFPFVVALVWSFRAWSLPVLGVGGLVLVLLDDPSDAAVARRHRTLVTVLTSLIAATVSLFAIGNPSLPWFVGAALVLVPALVLALALYPAVHARRTASIAGTLDAHDRRRAATGLSLVLGGCVGALFSDEPVLPVSVASVTVGLALQAGVVRRDRRRWRFLRAVSRVDAGWRFEPAGPEVPAYGTDGGDLALAPAHGHPERARSAPLARVPTTLAEGRPQTVVPGGHRRRARGLLASALVAALTAAVVPVNHGWFSPTRRLVFDARPPPVLGRSSSVYSVWEPDRRVRNAGVTLWRNYPILDEDSHQTRITTDEGAELREFSQVLARFEGQPLETPAQLWIWSIEQWKRARVVSAPSPPRRTPDGIVVYVRDAQGALRRLQIQLPYGTLVDLDE